MTKPRATPAKSPEGRPEVEPRTFLAPNTFETQHPHALALYCSDGRFTQAVEDLLRHRGEARLDTLTLPGGPALLDLWTASYTENEAVGQATTFLVHGHATARAFLLAHEGCGYYRAKFPQLSKAQLREKQLTDLRTAARWFRERHPSVAVELYFARPVDDRVAFDRVDAS